MSNPNNAHRRRPIKEIEGQHNEAQPRQDREQFRRLIGDIEGLISYCTDASEENDYKENPSRNHIYVTATRVATDLKKLKLKLGL